MHSPNYNICEGDLRQPKSAMFRLCVPRIFEEVGIITRNLKEGEAVALNLGELEYPESQQAIDFLCGSAQALYCNIERITEDVFIFTPANTKISVPTAEPKALPPVAVVDERRSWWTALGSVLLGGF
jgi:FtsZ-interacting cell division protein YlmF